VITRKQWTGPYFVTGSTPGKEGEGVAYFLTHSATTKRLKHSIPAHRLRLCMTDRTDLLAKYPNLDLQMKSGNTVDVVSVFTINSIGVEQSLNSTVELSDVQDSTP
jgi:hypothetical protein